MGVRQLLRAPLGLGDRSGCLRRTPRRALTTERVSQPRKARAEIAAPSRVLRRAAPMWATTALSRGWTGNAGLPAVMCPAASRPLGRALRRRMRVRVVHGRVVEVGLRASVLGAAAWTPSQRRAAESACCAAHRLSRGVSGFPRIAAGTARLLNIGAAATRWRRRAEMSRRAVARP